MGRSTTPKYRVEFTQAGFATGLHVAWPTGICGKPAPLGKPTTASLAQWVADYEASLKPGGVNAHLGYSPVKAAKVVNQKSRVVVAQYYAGISPLPSPKV